MLRDQILILWEDGRLYRVPPGDVWLRGDAVYGPCSLNWWPTGIIKVSDGTEVKVQYWPEGFIDIIVLKKDWRSPRPRTADPTDTSPGNRERGWPENPFLKIEAPAPLRRR